MIRSQMCSRGMFAVFTPVLRAVHGQSRSQQGNVVITVIKISQNHHSSFTNDLHSVIYSCFAQPSNFLENRFCDFLTIL